MNFTVRIVTHNKCQFLKKVLPHLRITYFISESRGAETSVCYIRPKVNTKGLEEGEDKRSKENVAVCWRRSGSSLCIQLILSPQPSDWLILFLL